jgi:flagellar basal-body rod modification protein FlgD
LVSVLLLGKAAPNINLKEMEMADSIQGLLGSTVTPQTSSSSSTGSTQANAFDMNSFLKMFLTQLQCQDPSNPMQSYELAAQLAQFSTVAQLTTANTTLSNIQSYSGAMTNADMASLVGKEVTANKTSIDVTSDNVSSLDYQLGSASNVTLSIKDASGDVIYSENKGAQTAGKHSVGWDGKDTSGTRVSSGTYTCEIEAVDSYGTKTTVQTTYQGLANSLTLNASSPYYILADGTKVAAADVVQVGTQSSSSQ